MPSVQRGRVADSLTIPLHPPYPQLQGKSLAEFLFHSEPIETTLQRVRDAAVTSTAESTATHRLPLTLRVGSNDVHFEMSARLGHPHPPLQRKILRVCCAGREYGLAADAVACSLVAPLVRAQPGDTARAGVGHTAWAWTQRGAGRCYW